MALEALFGELASAAGTEAIVAAGERLSEKIKSGYDIKKLFVETGEFFIDFEPDAEHFFDDMASVLSKENMSKLAKEMNDDTVYTLKKRLFDSIMSLMNRYEIPREYAILYANRFLLVILNQLPEVAPQKYDRYFQSEWREAQEATLNEIKTKIEKVNNELALYKREAISVESADQLDIQMRRQTNNPRIGIDFFDIDDDDDFKNAFADRIENEIIRVRAKCREEAVYCIVNELWRRDEKRAVFIVKSLEDWEKLSKSATTGNIYIPWFWAEKICAIENNTNIFIYTDGVPSFSYDEIVLRPRTFQTINNALVSAGLEINEANALVNETHGLYIPMKRKIFNGQYLKKPEWIEKLPENIKKAGVLAGQWTDAEGDQVILSALSGMKYEEFMECIMPFTKGDDPFIHVVKSYGEKTYYLASVENSWEYMDVDANDSIWQTFKRLFIDVLNESEKLFVYTAQERMAAQFKGERLFWSAVLRNGMIRSLIMKAFYRKDLQFQNSLDVLIFELLEYINTGEQWKYISDFFVDLCEIAPKAIIDRLFAEFEKSTGLWELFESQTSDFMWGKNYYINILFGVEEFLVQDEYAARGYEWLLRLDDKSYEYKSNAPKDSIGKVLCSWHNFSVFKTVDEKVFAARRALELDRNAWDYVFTALPSENGSILGELHAPKYRTHVDITSVTRRKFNQIVEQYIYLLIEKADFIPERWGKLLNIADELSDNLFDKIFSSALYQALQMSPYEQSRLKKQIRQLIYKNRYFSDASWAMEEETVKRYEELLDEIVIDIPEYEYAYLFDSHRDIILLHPIPYDEGKRDINEENKEKILRTKIAEFKEKKLDLRLLAEVCALEENSNLGTYMALYNTETAFNQNIFEVLFEKQDSKRMALDYCQGMCQKDQHTFEKVLQRKEEMAFDDDFLVKLYRIQAANTEEIPLIDAADDHMKELFWADGRFFFENNYVWALEECRRFGTIATYVELLYFAHENCRFSNERLYAYLVDIHKMRYDNGIGNLRYYLSALLKPVQEEYASDAERAKKIAEIEMNFFVILGWENMKCFQNEIKRLPDTYAEIASVIYKKNNAEREEEKSEEQKKIVQALRCLYEEAHFCPAEEDGVVHLKKLDDWVNNFKYLLEENHQAHLFGRLLGRLWAYSPAGSDGYCPCEAVREIIEKYADEDMIEEYKASLFNRRGLFSPSAGRGEKAIAEKYKHTADYFKIRYPKTAEVFYGMYRKYMYHAEEERSRAENGYF